MKYNKSNRIESNRINPTNCLLFKLNCIPRVYIVRIGAIVIALVALLMFTSFSGTDDYSMPNDLRSGQARTQNNSNRLINYDHYTWKQLPIPVRRGTYSN